MTWGAFCFRKSTSQSRRAGTSRIEKALSHCIRVAARGEPVQERLPGRLGRLAREPLGHHGKPHDGSVVEDDLFTPMRVEEAIAIVLHEPRDECAIVLRRCARGSSPDGAERLGQFARSQRQPRDDAETPAAAALECPEELGVAKRVDDADRAVGGYHLSLDETCRRRAEALREAAESAALHEACDADRAAAAALHVSPAFAP